MSESQNDILLDNSINQCVEEKWYDIELDPFTKTEEQPVNNIGRGCGGERCKARWRRRGKGRGSAIDEPNDPESEPKFHRPYSPEHGPTEPKDPQCFLL